MTIFLPWLSYETLQSFVIKGEAEAAVERFQYLFRLQLFVFEVLHILMVLKQALEKLVLFSMYPELLSS